MSEPDKLTATDSAGTDLTQIEKNVMGERDYVELVTEFNKPSTRFMLQLALTERKAATFDLQSDVIVTSYAGTKTHEVALDTGWVKLDPAVFDGHQVRCRLSPRETFDGSTAPQLTIEPGTVRDVIEEIQLVRNGQSVSSRGSMWNQQQITYSFDGDYHGDYRAKITLRTDVRETPVRIELTDQDLP